MLLTHLKTSLQYKLTPSKKMPEDTLLASLVNEAMYYVSARCVPSELLRDAGDTEYKVMRFVESGQFIGVPEYPDFSSSVKHLMIDEPLTFAVIYYTGFLISNEIIFKQMADEITNEYIANDGRVLNG